MKKILLVLLAAFVVAGTLTSFARSRKSFEEDLGRLEAAVSCPLKEELLENVPPDVAAVCAKYGDAAFRIAARYPKMAPRMFALYGELPQWKEVLDQYGHEVIPVVWYFQQGSREIQLRQALGGTIEHLLHGERPVFKIEDLAPEQLGYVAIMILADRGHDLLGQFEFMDGEARRRPIERTLSTLKEFLLGGVTQLEHVLIRGERRPNLGEVGSALLDVAVVAGGITTITRLRIAGSMAEDARVASRFGRLTALEVGGEAVGKSAMTLGRIVLPSAAVLGVMYLAVTHPRIVTGAGQWLAEKAGLAPWVGAFGMWLVLIIPILVLISPVVFAGRMTMKGMRLVLGRPRCTGRSFSSDDRQQPAMPGSGSSADALSSGPAAFRRALNEAGYVEGQNVAIEYRWAEGQYGRGRAPLNRAL